MDIEDNIQQYFKDYPQIRKGLRNIGVTSLSDFQQQLISIDANLDNVLVIAPETSGKILGIILLTLRALSNVQQCLCVYLSHSKDLSQKIFHLLSNLTKITITNLFMQQINQKLSPKSIIIGSPIQLQNLNKQLKQKITQLVIIQADLLLSFGYKQSLYNLSNNLSKQINYKITCCNKNQQLQQYKIKYIHKITKIDYQLPNQIKKQQKDKIDCQVVHFYQVGDQIMIAINLYVSLRFGLVNPKILILCQNIYQVYRYYLLLQCWNINNVILYNHQNPINLKFYNLSLWISGNINILITTKQLFEDINNKIFQNQIKKRYKKKQFDFINLSTIICLNLKHIENYFFDIFDSFPHKPFLMTFIQKKQQEINCLQSLMKYQQQKFTNVRKKQLPISRNQLEGFRYRINDVYRSVSKRKIQWFQQLDLKRKILKSPDLKEYFQENKKQKDVLIQTINDLKKKINTHKTVLSEVVPDYLVPQCLKSTYQEQLKNIQKDNTDTGPAYHEKVRKVLKYIDPDQQNPQTTDISRLKLISARKRWKLQHGFKLKKRNLRNQKKGIFQN